MQTLSQISYCVEVALKDSILPSRKAEVEAVRFIPAESPAGRRSWYMEI